MNTNINKENKMKFDTLGIICLTVLILSITSIIDKHFMYRRFSALESRIVKIEEHLKSEDGKVIISEKLLLELTSGVPTESKSDSDASSNK